MKTGNACFAGCIVDGNNGVPLLRYQRHIGRETKSDLFCLSTDHASKEKVWLVVLFRADTMQLQFQSSCLSVLFIPTCAKKQSMREQKTDHERGTLKIGGKECKVTSFNEELTSPCERSKANAYDQLTEVDV